MGERGGGWVPEPRLLYCRHVVHAYIMTMARNNGEVGRKITVRTKRTFSDDGYCCLIR